MNTTNYLIAKLLTYSQTPLCLPDDILKQAANRLELLERIAMAARKMKAQKWLSVEKDNMEFQCITTCFVLDELRDTLKALDDRS